MWWGAWSTSQGRTTAPHMLNPEPTPMGEFPLLLMMPLPVTDVWPPRVKAEPSVVRALLLLMDRSPLTSARLEKAVSRLVRAVTLIHRLPPTVVRFGFEKAVSRLVRMGLL